MGFIKRFLFSCTYLFRQDKKIFLSHIKNHPFLCFLGFFKIFVTRKKIFSKKSKEGIFLYNISCLEEAFQKIENPKITLLLGLSYCQKPKKCPIRFSASCIDCSKACLSHNLKDYLLPKDHFLWIPTAESLGSFLCDHAKNSLFFVICACPFSQKFFEFFLMFYPKKISGIGIPLTGSICKNFKEFAQAEKGNKHDKTSIEPDHVNLLKKILSKRNNRY